ncbi:Rhodanese- sulfurtransferase [Mycoemilia scoparia]|uniref:Ribosome biogenesis regulatory protein n=1 Tax=Mycoemilia scoparia TaxID=417184 RepID=A0A9W8DWB8_9FUNG|nr:Rhodanese- sulfurtransferase [Mycoemilia scoparia]
MDVSQVLEEHKKKFKSVQVEKVIPLEFDLGLLAAFDVNMLDEEVLRKGGNNVNEYLKSISRDNAQLLMNQIMEQPIEATEEGVMAQLPVPETVLPREKPIPKEKPMTRWEKFAKLKGIKKQKQSRMVYDEETGEYRPRWGYKGANNTDQEPWLIELGGNDDPMEDQYAKRREEKKDRVAKNQRRQQRNVEEAAYKSTKKGQTGDDARNLRKQELQKKLAQSKFSTASMGKFDDKMKGEPKIKSGKRKHDPTVMDAKEEKMRSKDLLNRVNRASEAGKNIVNTRKAQKTLKKD